MSKPTLSAEIMKQNDVCVRTVNEVRTLLVTLGETSPAMCGEYELEILVNCYKSAKLYLQALENGKIIDTSKLSQEFLSWLDGTDRYFIGDYLREV